MKAIRVIIGSVPVKVHAVARDLEPPEKSYLGCRTYPKRDLFRCERPISASQKSESRHLWQLRHNAWHPRRSKRAVG